MKMASTTGQEHKLEEEKHIPDASSSADTSVSDGKEEVSSSTSLDQEKDISSVIASEAASPPVHVSHKPPPRQFLLIMIALDQIIVSTSIPAITREFNSLNDVSWLGTAYMMTATAFQPMYGKFSDIFGRKATMLFANVVFVIGSAIAGWATSMMMLIIGRGVAGLGAGGLMAMVLIILSDMLDIRERGKYIGFIAAIFSLSSIIGPLLGGAFTDHVTWRWSFWINLPFGAISILFIAINLDLPTPKGSLMDKLKRIDYLGSLLLLISVILILLPLSWGGSTHPWNSGIVIGMLVAGFVVAGIFILVEWKVPNEPIIPIHLFKIRNLWSSYGSLFFSGMSFFGILFYLPIYFQVVKQESATIGGLETIPFVFGVVVTSISSGVWVLKKGTFAFFPAIGNTLFVAGSALCVVFQKDTHRVVTIFVLLLCGLGMGCLIQASTLAIQSSVKPKYMATVTSSVQFMRSLGQVFGVAIVGSVFNNKLQDNLEGHFPDDPSIMKVTLDYTYINTYAPAQILVIYDSFVGALRYVFYCSIAFCSLALISSLFIQHKELKSNTNQTKPEETAEMA